MRDLLSEIENIYPMKLDNSHLSCTIWPRVNSDETPQAAKLWPHWLQVFQIETSSPWLHMNRASMGRWYDLLNCLGIWRKHLKSQDYLYCVCCLNSFRQTFTRSLVQFVMHTWNSKIGEAGEKIMISIKSLASESVESSIRAITVKISTI